MLQGLVSMFCGVLLLYHSIEVSGSRVIPTQYKWVRWSFHRSLYDYKMYGAVTLERIDIPLHTERLNLTFNIYSSSDSCDVKHVKIFADEFGLPVVSRNDEVFPKEVFISEAPVSNISVASNNETVMWDLGNLHAGQLFLMAVMPQPDDRIKQQGLGVDCDYFMSVRATLVYYLEESIPTLRLDTVNSVAVPYQDRIISSFKVNDNAASFSVLVQGCEGGPCPLKVSLWGALSSDMWDMQPLHCHWLNGSCTVKVISPVVESVYYLGLVSGANATTTANITITIASCIMSQFSSSSTDLMNPSTSQTCVFTGRLGRETAAGAKESSNFYDKFSAWDSKFHPHSVINLNVSDHTDSVMNLKLRMTDTGSALKVTLNVPKQKFQEPGRVYLCLSPHHLPETTVCSHGAIINLTTQHENSSHVIVPYPKSGTWFIALRSQCFQGNQSSNTPVPCKDFPAVNVSAHLAPCVDGSCGQYGTCKLYFGSDILYSACNCYSGWRGYGCNDGSHAESESSEKVAVYLLTLSNLGFLPGILLAFYRRHYIEGLVYSYNMFFSSFYHACDTSEVYQLCILPYSALSFADFFASLLSFWVTLLAMARISVGFRSFCHMIGALLISIGVVYNRHGLIEQLLPIAGGIALVLVSWGIEIFKRKSIFPSKRRLLFFILPGIAMASLGLIFNLALETDGTYKYYHSLWHIMVSGAIIFLLPPRRGWKKKSSALSVQSGDVLQSGGLLVLEADVHSADHITDEPLEPISPLSTPQNRRNGRGFKLFNRNRRNQNFVL